MKTILIVFIASLYAQVKGFTQTDSIISAKTSLDTRQIETVTIINGVLFDSLSTQKILKEYSNKILRRKFYGSKDALKKWGILSRDGVVYIIMQEGVIIDIRKLKSNK